MSFSSAGIGSGLDVAGIINQLQAINNRSLQAFDTRSAVYSGQISVIGQLKSKLSTLETNVKNLTGITGANKLQGLDLKVSNAPNLQVSLSNSSKTSFQSAIKIDQIAQGQKLATQPIPSANTPLTSTATTLSFSFGSVSGSLALNQKYADGASFSSESSETINIAANATLQDIKDTINSQSESVRASIMFDGTGQRLILTNTNTGANSSMEITAQSGAGLDFLNNSYTSQANQQLSTTVEAQDLSGEIDGIPITSTTNQLNDRIEGVNILVTAPSTETSTIMLQPNATIVKKNLDSLVTAYNDLMSSAKNATKVDPENNTAGPLAGDSSARLTQTQLRRLFDNPNLVSIGVRFNPQGELSIDQTAFDAAMTQDPDAVLKAFAPTDLSGFGQTLAGSLKTMNEVGPLTSKTESLTTMQKTVQKQKEALSLRFEKERSILEAQFQQLDALISRFSNIQSSLSQTLGQLN